MSLLSLDNAKGALRRRVGLVVILGILISALLWLGKSSARQIPESLTFNLTNGQQLQARQLRGKPLLLNFWSVNCPICLHDMPLLAEFAQEMHSNGQQFLSVSIPQDPPPAILHTVQRLQIPFPVALDVHGEISRASGGIQVTPTFLVIDRQGMIVARLHGPADPATLRAALAPL